MKAFKIAGGLVALAFIGFGVFLATFDVGQYKGLIQEQVKAATGRDLAVGDIKLGLSLSPVIVVTDATLTNAAWGSKPQMVSAKRIEAGAELLPLLSGQIKITGIKLDGADVLLEVNREGKPNWVFDVPAASPSGAPPLTLSAVTVDGVTLNYNDLRAGQSAAIKLGKAQIKLAGDLSALELTALDLDGAVIDFKDRTQSASVKLGEMSIAAKGPLTAMNVTSVKLGETKASYKGGGGPIDLALKGASISADGLIEVSGEVSGQPIKAAGRTAPLGDLLALSGPVPLKLDVEALGLKIDTDLMADMSKKRPALTGAVTVPKLDLSALAGGAPASDQKAPAKGARPAPGERVFPDTPLPWDQLGASDADVKLTIGELTLPNGLTLKDVTVPVKLAAGVLKADGLGAELLGGRVNADLDLAQGSKSMALKIKAEGFTAENLSREFKVTDLIAQGPLDIAVDVRGTGNSLRAIMASLNGSVIGGMGESRIRNDALNVIGADVIMQVISAVNPMGNKDPYTVARCAVVNFQVANGVANTQNGIALVTDKMEVVSTGTINLATEQVDLAVRPKATSGLAVGLGNVTQAVKLAGPLSGPRVAVDAKGAVKALGSLGAAFATGGASLLAQGQIDKNTGGDPCAAARVWHQQKKR